MLKTIKKALLLSFFVNLSFFPMKQVSQVALARTLNQVACFRSSPCVKCPIISSILIAEMIAGSATPELHASFTAEDQYKSMLEDQQTQEQIDLNKYLARNSNQDYKNFSSQSKSEIADWNQKINKPIDKSCSHIISDNAQAVREYFPPLVNEDGLRTVAIVAHVKTTFFDIAGQFSTNVKEDIAKFVNDCQSLSYDAILEKRESLVKDHDSAIRLYNLFRQKNDEICRLLDEYKKCIDPLAAKQMLSAWPVENYCKALVALKLEFDMRTTWLEAKECDAIIQRVKQETCRFANTLKNISLERIEHVIAIDLAAEQKTTEVSIAQERQALEGQNKRLKDIDAQLELFITKPIRAKAWEWCNSDHSREYLNDCKQKIEVEIKNTSKRLQSLCLKNKVYDAQAECAKEFVAKEKQAQKIAKESEFAQEKQREQAAAQEHREQETAQKQQYCEQF